MIILVTWFLVEVGVAINTWYAPFYDLIGNRAKFAA
ncbi:SbmA/BacA-like family transporter [Shigella flexneri]